MITYRIILSVFGIKLVLRLNPILLKTNKLWKTYCTWILLFVNLKKQIRLSLLHKSCIHNPTLPFRRQLYARTSCLKDCWKTWHWTFKNNVLQRNLFFWGLAKKMTKIPNSSENSKRKVQKQLIKLESQTISFTYNNLMITTICKSFQSSALLDNANVLRIFNHFKFCKFRRNPSNWLQACIQISGAN